MSQQDTSNYVVINNSATKLQITVSVYKGDGKREQRGEPIHSKVYDLQGTKSPDRTPDDKTSDRTNLGVQLTKGKYEYVIEVEESNTGNKVGEKRYSFAPGPNGLSEERRTVFDVGESGTIEIFDGLGR